VLTEFKNEDVREALKLYISFVADRKLW
jgi:hypothetical protein